jgi:hypothetical protein
MLAIMGEPSPESASKEFLQWYELNDRTGGLGSWQIPGVSNLFHLRGAWTHRGDAVFGTVSHSSIRKAPARRLRRLQQLIHTLGIETASDDPAVLCEILATAQINVRAYPRLHINGTRPRLVLPRLGSHYFRHVEERSRVSFVVAMCLFGSRSVHLYDRERGTTRPLPMTAVTQRVDDVWADAHPSFYELETAVRLAELVAAVARRIPVSVPCEIILLAPREQYYLYLLEGWENGLVPTSVLLRWLCLVDQRHALVSGLLRQQIHQSYSQYGGRQPIKFRMANALQGIGTALADWAAGGSPVSLTQCLDRLSRNNRVWRHVLEFQRPRTWSKLWYLSYAVEQLQAGRLDMPDDRTQVLVIQEPSEELTFGTADRLASQIQAKHKASYSSCALFPLENAIATNQGQRTSPYHNSPSHEFTDDQGREWNSREIVHRVHGVWPVAPENNDQPPKCDEVTAHGDDGLRVT